MTEPLLVLIVDDDKLLASTVAEILSFYGHVVEVAYNASQGLSFARAKRFDVVLSDIRMPGMSGVDLLKALHDLDPELPVVLMTGDVRGELVSQEAQRDAAAILNKPLEIDQLMRLFSSLVRPGEAGAEVDAEIEGETAVEAEVEVELVEAQLELDEGEGTADGSS